MEIIFKKSSWRVKESRHLKKNVFIIYSSKTVKIEPATSIKINAELVLLLPKIQKDSLHRYFEETKLMNSVVKNKVCG